LPHSRDPLAQPHRANELAKGIVGKRLTYRRPNKKTFRFKAKRFLRWRKKNHK
jgi:hypothetical protein